MNVNFWILYSLNAPLASLAEKLKPEDFVYCKATWGIGAESVYTCKGVFPYSWLDSWDKLEVAELPEKQALWTC